VPIVLIIRSSIEFISDIEERERERGREREREYVCVYEKVYLGSADFMMKA
jgi:hypothetical protein